MAKSLEDRAKENSLSPIYDTIKKNYPVLTKGLFKPDLGPLCDKYDGNLDAYRELVKKKAGLSKYLDQLSDTLDSRDKTVGDLNDQCTKSWKENNELTKKYGAQLKGFIDQGDKADTTKVVDSFKSYADQYKEMIEVDKAHADRKEKLNAQVATDIKKECDGYEKDAKSIKSAEDKLAGDEDNLEKQIRAVVLSYQKTAVKIDKPDLENALEDILKAFP